VYQQRAGGTAVAGALILLADQRILQNSGEPGSLPRFGSSSFVTSSDCSTSRSFASTGSTV